MASTFFYCFEFSVKKAQEALTLQHSQNLTYPSEDEARSMRQSMTVLSNDLTFLVSMRQKLRKSNVPTKRAAAFSIACRSEPRFM